jgi:pilus assembly protein CpaC
VVNLLHIPGEQQVMLKVVVAEVSRDAARSIGIDWSITNKAGRQVFAQKTGSLLGGAAATTVQNAAGNTGASSGTSLVNLPILIDQGRINIALEALRAVNLAKSLAEPNLVTLNGHQANFRAGGEFPVPVVTGATAVGLQGVSFVPFGVSLGFTPYITDKDRIRLQLNAVVSTRNDSIGANFGTGNNTSTAVPGLNSRTINTTVEMREGQTLAIGGLLQTSLGGTTIRVPFFGDIPCGGQLFRLDTTSAGESELVLLVTPELVHPLEPKEVPPLPGSDYYEPGDLEFYLKGRLESLRNYDYRSPVMDEIHRMCAYRHCEEQYFVGPHGHIQDRTPHNDH